MRDTTPTLADVAALAGVCVSTASRILRARPESHVPYAPETQERVRKAATKLRYKPSRLARGLVGSQSGMVGLVVPSVQDSFFPRIVTDIQMRLADRGFSTLLANTRMSSTAEHEAIEELLAWHADGMICAPVMGSSDVADYWDLWRRGIPFVLFDRLFPGAPFCSVTSDDHKGAVLAVEHLLALGRNRIGILHDEERHTASTRVLRFRSYRETLMRHGIRFDASLVARGTVSREGGKLAARELLALPKPPDSFFFLSDREAAGAMEECLEQGLRIPEDIALVGYADLDYSDVLRIPLTTVRQPAEAMAKATAEMFIALVEGHKPEVPQLVLPVELVVRQSTVGEPT